MQHEFISDLQKTLNTKVTCIGVGVHSGDRARMTINPAPINTGYVFVRTDVPSSNARIEALAKNVTATQLGTTITNEHGVFVSTVEHILAALSGIGIDNAIIEIDGEEVPILDGSSEPFIELFKGAGLRTQAAPKRMIEILKPIEVRDGNKYARLEPYNGFALDVEIDFSSFGSKAIGIQHGSYEISKGSFMNDLSKARTFGFMHQVEALRRMGLSRGGSLDNAVVIDGDEILNEGGLRFNDEFVRHKALDAVGDLALCGQTLLGRYVSYQSGHSLNVALVKALAENQDSWRFKILPLDAQKMAAAGL